MKLEAFKKLKKVDWDAMETSEIKSLVQYGARVLNPRINRLYHQVELSKSKKVADDAYLYTQQTGGLFSTVRDDLRMKDGVPTYEKTRDELIHELKREVEFSKMETSTVTGARRVRKEREDILRKNYTKEDLKGKSQEEINKILDEEWEKFRKFNEEHGVIYKQGKIDELYQMYMSDAEKQKEEEMQNDVSTKTAQLLEDVERDTSYKPKYKTI